MRCGLRPREPHPSRVERGLLSHHSIPGVWKAAMLWPAGPAAYPPGCHAGPEKWARCLGPRSTYRPPCCVRKGGGAVACMQSPLESVPPHPHKCHPGLRPSYQRHGCVPSSGAQCHIDICRSARAISLAEKAPSQRPCFLPETVLAPVSHATPRKLFLGGSSPVKLVSFIWKVVSFS